MTDGVIQTDAIRAGAALKAFRPPEIFPERIKTLKSEAREPDSRPETEATPEKSDRPDKQAEMIRDLKRSLSVFDIEAEYYVDKSTNMKVIRIRDAQNQELIRQVPTEEFLEHARTMHKLVGLLFDEKA